MPRDIFEQHLEVYKFSVFDRQHFKTFKEKNTGTFLVGKKGSD
jgi:hypothetical protein